MKPASLKFGIDVFVKKGLYRKFTRYRSALLTNQSAFTEDLIPSYFRLKETLGRGLRFLFTPQHGLFGEKQANMVASPDEVEPFFNLSVISLYGPRLAPEPHHLKELDLVFIDLQEVGCRVYTYIWSMFLMLKICESLRLKVVVLDRPNPLGSVVEGPFLEKEFFSFVGLDDLPLRHGLTIGELAQLFRRRHFPSLELEVVPCEGYQKSCFWVDLHLPWINPSPNLPNFDAALCYPGFVLLEGTNLSEGRGTTKPFTTFGSPYLKIDELYPELRKLFPTKDWGVVFRPVAFEPTFDKWKGKRCYGFEMHILEPRKFRPVELALRVLKLMNTEYEDFQFLDPPYEFEEQKRPIEILIGQKKVLTWLLDKSNLELDWSIIYNTTRYQEEVSLVSIYEK